jgi:uncharacterized membrane protein
VFSSPAWQKAALLLNLLGTVVLFLSFQATSSNVKIVRAPDGRTALCVDARGLVVDVPPAGLQLGTHSCPDWENARPAAVINIEHPMFITIGFLLISLGFLIQFLSVSNPATLQQLRDEMKRSKRKRY